MWIFSRNNSNTTNTSPIKNTQETSDSSKIVPEKQFNIVTINIKLQEIQQSMKLIDNIPSTDKKLIGTLQNLMKNHKILLGMVEKLMKQHTQYMKKIMDYDHMTQTLSNHHTMIVSLQQSSQEQLRTLYNTKQSMQNQLNNKISQLQELNKKYNQESIHYKQKVQLLSKQNLQMKNIIQELKMNLSNKQVQEQKLKNRLQLLLSSNDHKQYQIKQINMEIARLQNVFYYSKFRTKIMTFLEVQDNLVFFAVNRTFRYLCNQDLLKITVQNAKNYTRRQVNKAMQKATQYEKIYDNFPSEQIRLNALKYLFFKIKPGTYIRSFIYQNPVLDNKNQQQLKEQQNENKNENPTDFLKNTIKSFFRQNFKISAQQQKFNFKMLKNEKQFKLIQNKINNCFNKLFQIHLPEDLQLFQQYMNHQFEDLKFEIKQYNNGSMMAWSSQLVCFARFLYLETYQINHLLQVCFGQLLQCHNQIKLIKCKCQDMTTNQITLRNLVKSMAQDRQKIQKDQWRMENQMLNERQRKEKQTIMRQSYEVENKRMKSDMSILKEQNNQLKVKLQKMKRQRQNFEQKMNVIQSQLMKIDLRKTIEKQ